jgi:hypothetical protein
VGDHQLDCAALSRVECSGAQLDLPAVAVAAAAAAAAAVAANAAMLLLSWLQGV